VGDPHVDYGATTASCAACHRAHTAQGLELRDAWPEEGVCFACHTAGGPGTNVELSFTQYANTDTAYFKHDIAATAGIHLVGQTEGSDFGTTNRHVECEDCHEPHHATRGDTSPPVLQREMNLVAGVDPLWTAPGMPDAFSWLPQAGREYQVCFKCHSSFTTLPNYAPDGWDGATYVPDGLAKLTNPDGSQVRDQRDMAQEFNPYNASFHPVTAVGRNQTMPAGSFVPGWSSTSLVYCSDCHTNAGQGPHGSPRLHLLDGSSDYQTADPDDPIYTGGEICFQCHDAADYIGTGRETNFRRGNRNLHKQHSDNGSCYLCHDSHGSEQLHLLNLDLSITTGLDSYLLPGYDGQPTNSQTFWQINAAGTEKTCWLVCHGHNHGDSPYPNVSD
jgi:predicted CXXCH cytochrome family protein